MMATVHEQRQRMIEHALLRDPGAVAEVSIRLWQQLAVALNQISASAASNRCMHAACTSARKSLSG